MHFSVKKMPTFLSHRESVLEALEIRFGELPPGLRDAIHQVFDESKLRALHRAAIQAPDLEAFANTL